MFRCENSDTNIFRCGEFPMTKERFNNNFKIEFSPQLFHWEIQQTKESLIKRLLIMASCSSSDPPTTKKRSLLDIKRKEFSRSLKPSVNKQFWRQIDEHQPELLNIYLALKDNPFMTDVIRNILNDQYGVPENNVFRQIINSQGDYKKPDIQVLKFSGWRSVVTDTSFFLFLASIKNNLDKVNLIILQFMKKHEMNIPYLLDILPLCSNLNGLHLDRVRFSIDHFVFLFEKLSAIKDQITELSITDSGEFEADVTGVFISNSKIGISFKKHTDLNKDMWGAQKYVCDRIKSLKFFKNNQTLQKFTIETKGRSKLPIKKPAIGKSLDLGPYLNCYYFFIDQMFLDLSKGCAIESMHFTFGSAGARDLMAEPVIHLIIYCLEHNTLKFAMIDNINFESLTHLARFWNAFKINVSLESFEFHEHLNCITKLKEIPDPFFAFETKPNLKELYLYYHDSKMTFTSYLFHFQGIFQNLESFQMTNYGTVATSNQYHLIEAVLSLLSNIQIRQFVLHTNLGEFETEHLANLEEIIKNNRYIEKLRLSDALQYPRHYWDTTKLPVDIISEYLILRNFTNRKKRENSLFHILLKWIQKLPYINIEKSEKVKKNIIAKHAKKRQATNKRMEQPEDVSDSDEFSL